VRSLITALGASIADGQAACIVTVVCVRGSAPRDPGACMMVTATSTLGTIGGGQLEYQCIKLASERIRVAASGDQSNALRTFPLGSNCGQCCGGVVEVLFENVNVSENNWLGELNRLHELQQNFIAASSAQHGRALLTDDAVLSFGVTEPLLDNISIVAREMLAANENVRWSDLSGEHYFFRRITPSDFTIAIFGAGHVGSATVAALAALDCRIRWIDGRRNSFPASAPENVLMILTETPAREVAAMPPGSYFLIMTHSHALDFDICDQVLRRRDATYCGLIGSLSKRRRFERLMRKQGMDDELLANLTCPIGVCGIPGKRPQEISIAVAAEMLQIRSRVEGLSQSGVADNVHAI